MTFKVVILSARAENLIPCVQSIIAHEPDLPRKNIIVVDDGARAEAKKLLPDITWTDGEKPFVFARNANVGLTQACADTILLNDDARLMTPQGFSLLSKLVRGHPELGLCSAAVKGLIGNPAQRARPGNHLRNEHRTLAFVCVYIPLSTYQRVGPLDERFTGYGFEDNDYCKRALDSGYRLGIWDGCVVDHSGKLLSTFRTKNGLNALFRQNQVMFQAKWRNQGQAAVNGKRNVDLLYLAWNRLEFTQETFATMVANTDWDHVRELFIYDDGSHDGTREWLESQVDYLPVQARLVKTNFRSPVNAMSHFIKSAQAPILAKTDNDAMLPPGWLGQSLDVLNRHTELTMLGIEAMVPVDQNNGVVRSYTPADFISGLGLYRRVAFMRSRPAAIRRYFGLEEWQQARRDQIKVGWITPALPVFLLDRMPIEPWRHYSEQYISRGWQRRWPNYDLDSNLWQWRWPKGRSNGLPIGASSGSNGQEVTRRLNITHLAEPLPGHENVSILSGLTLEHANLKQGWPWDDNSFYHIVARDVVEHLPNKVETMNELWRVLRPGGTVEIAVLTTDGPGAWQDPTHVSFWNRRSFLYYQVHNPYRDRFARSYGVIARFRVVHEHTQKTVDGPRQTIVLRAVKTRNKDS